jgi:DNA-binding NtrC family response regulator
MEMNAVGSNRSRYVPPEAFSPDTDVAARPSRIIEVLCVFENPVLLDRICRQLEQHGDITVDICISGEDALHLMRYVPIDAIVTEYVVTPMEKNDLLKAVRGRGTMVPFIYFTHTRDARIEEEARRYGGVFFVEWEEKNPFTGFKELYRAVKRAVGANQRKKKSPKGGISDNDPPVR